MGKLTAVSIEGMKIWFWSKDHNPSLSREARWPMGVSCFLLGRRRRANVSAPMGQSAFESRQKGVGREGDSASRRDL